PGRDRDVLREQSEAKTAREPARQHLPREVRLGVEAAAGRGVQYVDDDRGVEAEASPDEERLGGGCVAGGRDEVVERLHRVPRAERTGPEQALAERLEQRADTVDRRLVVATDHDGKGARLRFGDTARDWRVDERDAELSECRPQLPRPRWIRRAHVDDDC